jgi:hypothetical protein
MSESAFLKEPFVNPINSIYTRHLVLSSPAMTVGEKDFVF